MKTIGSKITKVLIFIGIIAILVALTIGYFQNNSVGKKQIELRTNALQQMVNEKLWKKKDVGLTNAVGFAANGTIKEAVKTSNRELAIKELQSIGKQYKENTNFKGIKIHLHTNDMKSFVRSWKINNYGDDLSSFRHSIKEIRNSKKAGVYYELGKSGMFIRGIVPILDNQKYLGSLEFMQGVGSVNRDFAKEHMHYMMLLNEKAVSISKKVAQNKKYGNLYVSNMKWFKPKTLEFMDKINLNELKQNGFYFDENYFATILPLKDLTGTVVGYHIIGESSKNILSSINKVKSFGYTYLGLIFALILVIVVTMIMVINSTITKPLQKFQNGLDDFFKFINREQNSITKLDDSYQDEIGCMAKKINQNLERIEEDTRKDLGVFGEVMSFSEKLSSGDFTARIHLRASNGRINHIVDSLNDMGTMLNKSIGRDMDTISKVLESYGKYDFRASINNPQGDVEKTTNLLGNMVSTMLAENRKNGLVLENYATTLTRNVVALNQSANKQAVSLEETAASAEEITSLIQHSTEKAETMKDISDITKNSAIKGKKLSTQTATAMDEINVATQEIEDAITVIDQIAFQTNILSLNAAVEAATAGEAGKGFAVVAGEVRNLAARSAEAAKEIKLLVERARIKADEGKTISEDMATGYNDLEKNIEQTNELISDVTSAAKEQLDGMNQINDSMASLDLTTQENAKMAAETNQIARDTESIAKTVVENTNDKEFEEKD